MLPPLPEDRLLIEPFLDGLQSSGQEMQLGLAEAFHKHELSKLSSPKQLVVRRLRRVQDTLRVRTDGHVSRRVGAFSRDARVPEVSWMRLDGDIHHNHRCVVELVRPTDQAPGPTIANNGGPDASPSGCNLRKDPSAVLQAAAEMESLKLAVSD
jgi:hypothetical protein